MFVVNTRTWLPIMGAEDPEWNSHFGGKDNRRVGELRVQTGTGTVSIIPLSMVMCRLWNQEHSVGSFFGVGGKAGKEIFFDNLPPFVRISIIPHFSGTMMAAIQKELAGAWRFDVPTKEMYYKHLVLNRDSSKPPGASMPTRLLSKTPGEQSEIMAREADGAPGKLTEKQRSTRETILLVQNAKHYKELELQLASRLPTSAQSAMLASHFCEVHSSFFRALIVSTWLRAVRHAEDQAGAVRPHDAIRYPPALRPKADRHAKEFHFLDTRTATEIRARALVVLPPRWGPPSDWTSSKGGRKWLVLAFFFAQVNPYYTRVLLGLHDSLRPLDAAIHAHCDARLPAPSNSIAGRLPEFARWAGDTNADVERGRIKEMVYFWHSCADPGCTPAFMMSRYQTCDYEEFIALCFGVWGNLDVDLALPKTNGTHEPSSQSSPAHSPSSPTRCPPRTDPVNNPSSLHPLPPLPGSGSRLCSVATLLPEGDRPAAASPADTHRDVPGNASRAAWGVAYPESMDGDPAAPGPRPRTWQVSTEAVPTSPQIGGSGGAVRDGLLPTARRCSRKGARGHASSRTWRSGRIRAPQRAAAL